MFLAFKLFISCLIHIVAEFWHRLGCQLVVGFSIYQGWVDIWKVIFIVQDAFRNFILCLLDLSSFFFSPMRLTCRAVDSPTKRVDPLLNSYSDYEDSVYGNKVKHYFLGPWFWFQIHHLKITGLTWSSREPWIFASLSYDGRVRILEHTLRILEKPVN